MVDAATISESCGAAPERACAAPSRLKRRAEFLEVARGTRVHCPAFTLQARKRGQAGVSQTLEPTGARVGLTVTKKTGGAVERNRIRRRLREALRHAKALSTEPETDYVVVARREALSIPFGRLTEELQLALRKADAQLRKPRGSGKGARGTSN